MTYFFSFTRYPLAKLGAAWRFIHLLRVNLGLMSRLVLIAFHGVDCDEENKEDQKNLQDMSANKTQWHESLGRDGVTRKNSTPINTSSKPPEIALPLTMAFCCRQVLDAPMNNVNIAPAWQRIESGFPST